MSALDPVLIIKVAGFGGFLWLGLYIISRTTAQTRLSIVSAVAMFVTAAFLFSSAIIENNSTGLGTGGPLVSRVFWWSNVLPMALWFHMSSLIARRGKERRNSGWAVLLIYLVAGLIILVGTFSDLFLNYSSTVYFGENRFYTDIGSAYFLFSLLLAVSSLGAMANLAQGWLHARRQGSGGESAFLGQLGLLFLGALLFAFGANWQAFNFSFKIELPNLPANLALLLGLGLIGYGVAHFGMLIEGRDVERDFIYSFTGIALICVVYTIILGLTGANSTLNLLIVVGLAILSHTLYDFGRSLLDKIFFSSNEQTARAEARAYATELATQPAAAPELQEAIAAPPETAPALVSNAEAVATSDTNQPATPLEEIAVSEKSFNDMVRRAITGLKSQPQMIKSPLLSLKLVEQRLSENELEDNRLNRASALREILIEAIEHLRPSGPDNSGTGDAWRFYNVLYYPYVREISRKAALSESRRLYEERRRTGQREAGELEKVLEWLTDVDEDTFYKWQRKASDTIAAFLRERELKVQSGTTLRQPSPIS